ncbi:MAG: GldG family protein [Bacteroidota bacterium]
MKRDWTSRTMLLIVGGILVVLNLIAVNLFVRADLTDDGVYSLSDASIRLVENLDDPVTLKAFFTDDLPAPYSSNRRFLKDKLDDYRAYGGDFIQYEFVDPVSDEAMQEEAARFQIPPVQVQTVENDEVSVKNAYMGLGISYGGEREVIPVVQNMETLEYDITSAIKKLTRDRLPVVGFLSGHGEPSLAQDLSTVQQVLSRTYDVQNVTVNATGALSVSPDVLVVMAPTDSLPQADLRAIDDYIMGGGRVGFFLNRVNANLQMGQASAFGTGLEPVLESYGIRINEDLVADEQSSAVSVQNNQGGFRFVQRIDYPLLPIATNFSPDNIAVSRLREALFYFASTIDTSLVVDGVTVEPLIASSERSSTQEGFFMIQPQMLQGPFVGGPFVMAAAYDGSFPSAFELGRSSVDTRLVAVGDGDWLNQSILGQLPPSNLQLALNLIDYLAQDDDLLTIRSKSIAPRQLDFVEESARPWIKYAMMLFPTLLVVAFGLVRWRVRQAQAKIMRG